MNHNIFQKIVDKMESHKTIYILEHLSFPYTKPFFTYKSDEIPEAVSYPYTLNIHGLFDNIDELITTVNSPVLYSGINTDVTYIRITPISRFGMISIQHMLSKEFMYFRGIMYIKHKYDGYQRIKSILDIDLHAMPIEKLNK